MCVRLKVANGGDRRQIMDTWDYLEDCGITDDVVPGRRLTAILDDHCMDDITGLPYMPTYRQLYQWLGY